MSFMENSRKKAPRQSNNPEIQQMQRAESELLKERAARLAAEKQVEDLSLKLKQQEAMLKEEAKKEPVAPAVSLPTVPVLQSVASDIPENPKRSLYEKFQYAAGEAVDWTCCLVLGSAPFLICEVAPAGIAATMVGTAAVLAGHPEKAYAYSIAAGVICGVAALPFSLPLLKSSIVDLKYRLNR